MIRLSSVYITLFIIINISNINGRLSVFSPIDLKEAFPPPRHDMDYTIADFGKIPYGKTLMGILYYSNPPDGCSSMNRTNIHIEGNENDQSNTPIVMVERGNCSFTTKAKYAQLIGAKMLIIIDNKNENISGLILGDDGYGRSVEIPTVMIGKTSGKIMKTYIKANPDTDITIVATFPLAVDKYEVSAEFWFSSADANAYPFLADFGGWVDELGTTLNFIPHYLMWSSSVGKKLGYSEPLDDCLSAGRYCSPDPDGVGPASGETVLKENLRQICIWNSLGRESWFHYVEEFGNNCLYWDDEDCPNKIMKEMGWDSAKKTKVSECMDNSFISDDESSTVDEKIDDNILFKAEMEAYARSAVPYWPVLMINKSPYQGSISGSSEEAVKKICGLLSEENDFCDELMNRKPLVVSKDNETHYLAIFLILLGMVVILLVMLFFYRRMMRREMTKEMSIQISQMVSHYFAINEGGSSLNPGRVETDKL